MSRLVYCLKLAWLDLTRLWSSTQHHVIIVAGIVLPLLLLMGLKRGHVAELRQELLRSPTGRQIVIWSTREDALLEQETLDRLADLAHVELVIPESERVAEISRVESVNPSAQSAVESQLPEPVFSTIYPTAPGDPILRQVGLDILSNGESGVILSEELAEKLQVVVGDRIMVTLTRSGANSREQEATQLEIRGILLQPNEKSAIAYVNIELLSLFERWIRGGSVGRYNWPASQRPAADRYASYLMFVERPSTPSEDDLRTLEDRGLHVRRLKDPRLQSLFGLIAEDKLDRLEVWQITPSTAEQDPSARLSLAPSEIEGLTSVDDMLVPWNPPRQTDTQPPLLIGLTLPNRSRLRAEFFTHPGLAFKASEDLNEIILVEANGQPVLNPLASGVTISMGEGERPAQLLIKPRALALPESEPAISEPASGTETTVKSTTEEKEEREQAAKSAATPEVAMGIVPCQLLARLDAIAQGRAMFDPLTQTIVQIPDPPRYGKARLYATEIDRIPEVVGELQQRGFAVLSESGRIAEIQQQDNSLQLLVWIVGLGVLLFGILTVFSVLLDSTDRKRGTIGILRVMGVSRTGVFLMVVLRAASIGLIAGFVSLLAGALLARFFAWIPPAGASVLQHKPVMSILFHSVDLAIVLAGAILCSCLGALLPAWRAAKVDPFDAIVEGRFK